MGSIHARRPRYAGLAVVLGTVGAMLLVAHTSACAAGLPQQSGGSLPSGTSFSVDP